MKILKGELYALKGARTVRRKVVDARTVLAIHPTDTRRGNNSIDDYK